MTTDKQAVEIDALRAINADLLAALERIANAEYGIDIPALDAIARAAIARAKGSA